MSLVISTSGILCVYLSALFSLFCAIKCCARAMPIFNVFFFLFVPLFCKFRVLYRERNARNKEKRERVEEDTQGFNKSTVGK